MRHSKLINDLWPVATPTCSDLVKNQNETDIDCGGVACGATCDEGDACLADTDCASNNCSELVCGKFSL